MMTFYRSIFLNANFFYALGIGILLMFLGFFFPLFIEIAQFYLIVFCLINFIDAVILWGGNKLSANRKLSHKLSNGDVNKVELNIVNKYSINIHLQIIDELPKQFDVRDFSLKTVLNKASSTTLYYTVKPLERGLFEFGGLNIFVSTALGFLGRRYIFNENAEVKVYPSYIHLNKYELIGIQNNLQFPGIKKKRRIGHSMEFEQIKEYVTGDDWRTVNWKATSKTHKLMVNQYSEEKSQMVYTLIDKGRMMKMPFDGLTLLDYSINSALIFTHVVLQNQDRAGLITFSKRVDQFVQAERRSGQINQIMESLYQSVSDFKESDYGRLYRDIRERLRQYSLLLLYTNFDSMDALKRQLRYLKAISGRHLLVIIFFKNTELYDIIKVKTKDVREIHDRVVAEKFVYEQRLIVKELQKYGIHSILTDPKDLTVNVINKYLEIKARGLI
ncbi:MAG: DUF58 domain-containing protein [Saprospiraceae bacterium]|nr:DUF58 domain-containing protein [Saprospiraceae bacterium]